MPQQMDIIGLFPAAGSARRLQPLPCSKEILPIGFGTARGTQSPTLKVAGDCLLHGMHAAGAEQVFVILRDGKWDVPSYFGAGRRYGLRLAYLTMRASESTPHTLDHAYPFVNDALVLVGFPDVLFHPYDAFVHLIERQRETEAAVVLGLFPARYPQKVDMVGVDDDGRVQMIDIKPVTTSLAHTWVIAVWTPAFTNYLHTFIGDHTKRQAHDASELFVGDVIRSAIRDGWLVQSVTFDDGMCADVGTSEELAAVWHAGGTLRSVQRA